MKMYTITKKDPFCGNAQFISMDKLVLYNNIKSAYQRKLWDQTTEIR